MSGGAVHLVGGAFVDDTFLVEAMAWDDPFGMATVARAQSGLDQFVGEIRVMGGNIRPDKCWWYLIDFFWKDGKWHYTDIGEEDPALQVRTLAGEEVLLIWCGALTAAKVLGMWLSPDGNNDQAVEEMCHQSVEWADTIQAGHFWKADVEYSYHSMLCKRLEYPLLALVL